MAPILQGGDRNRGRKMLAGLKSRHGKRRIRKGRGPAKMKKGEKVERGGRHKNGQGIGDFTSLPNTEHCQGLLGGREW